MSDAESLTAVADRQAITDQLYRYCRAMDRIDAELGYSVFHVDAVVDYGADVYQGGGRGFIDQVCAQHRGAVAHSHQVTNIIIELDGDRAASEAYCFMAMRIAPGGQPRQIQVWSRYLDQWSRRDGRWAIDRRTTIRDLDEIRDVVPVSQSDRSRRDLTDPSYEILRPLR